MKRLRRAKRMSVLPPPSHPCTDSDESSSYQVKASLDLYLHYLRLVFHTCYYCTSAFNFVEELGEICGRHLRYAVGSHVSIRDEAGAFSILLEAIID